MKAGGRPGRVAAALKRHLAPILQKEATGAVVTVQNVEVTPDLSVAKVFVSVLGADERGFQKLAARVSAMRGAVGRQMGLARAPELRLIHDHSLEFQQKLRDIVREDEARNARDEA